MELSPSPEPKVVLTIAGSDSSGGAGVQADLKVFQACGVHGACAVTALTAQDSRGVLGIHAVPPRFVARQIDAAALDFPLAAAKSGMLHREQVVRAVAERVRRRRIPNLVVDPVILAKDGTPLLHPRGVQVLKERLLPLALLATPNVPEAELLSGTAIRDAQSLRAAARQIARLGVAGVVIKGGHLPGEPVDTLFWEDEFHEIPGARLEGPPVHGTGCLYSAAVAARIALGDAPPAACAAAKALVRRAIRAAAALGRGARLVSLLGERETAAAPPPQESLVPRQPPGATS